MTTVPVPHPLIVHVTGGGTSLTTILIIIAGAVATVSASIVSAWVITKTTKRTVEAEDRRMRERHAFERGETDRAELRQILDSIAQSIYAAGNAIRSLGLAVTLTRTGSADTRQRMSVEWDRQYPLALAAHDGLTAGRQRLQARLDVSEQPLDLISHAALAATGDALSTLVLHQDDEAAVREMMDGTKFERLYREFVTEARAFTGAELYRPPEPK